MPRYYEFEVSMQDIQPRIWRRFLLRTTATFAQLHKAIQDSFGWEERHLWEFRLPSHQGLPIAGPAGGDDYGRPTPDARFAKLNDYFTGQRVVEWCEYLYDFGDDWIHDVKLIRTFSEKQAVRRRLLDGERAAPPEDCGGPPGHERMTHFVETGEDLHGDDPEELARWLGGWRPDAFDLASAREQFDR